MLPLFVVTELELVLLDAVVVVKFAELETGRSSDREGVIGDCRLGRDTAGLAKLAGEGRIPEGLVRAGEGSDIPGEVKDIPAKVKISIFYSYNNTKDSVIIVRNA